QCGEIDRPYSEIEKTTLNSGHLAPDKMSTEDVINVAKKHKELGIDHVLFNMSNALELTPLETYKDEIIPAIIDL
ncbi:MAG: LLM class F420-dependent oxidoreductase, partial [Candidatus Kariarchaeaceae archaeon]